jgi:hypothetical protein
MIRVLRHGNTISVENPVTGEWQNMINVTFVEEGRGGADKTMSDTTAYLDSLFGDQSAQPVQTGLNQVRIHTHPVLADKIGMFPVGAEFPGHINRSMYSTPQLRQQTDKDARMIDGRPTYFKTFISATPEEDKDFRMDNDTIAKVKPSLLFTANVQAARVNILETAQEAGRGANPLGYRAQQGISNENVPPTEDFITGIGRGGNATRQTPSPSGAPGSTGVAPDQRSEEQRDFPA